jgi:hypothetical protein
MTSLSNFLVRFSSVVFAANCAKVASKTFSGKLHTNVIVPLVLPTGSKPNSRRRETTIWLTGNAYLVPGLTYHYNFYSEITSKLRELILKTMSD